MPMSSGSPCVSLLSPQDISDVSWLALSEQRTDGQGHGALATLLQNHAIDTLICGGIGAGAQNALAAAGITLYGGCSGSADAAVEALLANKLDYNPTVRCNHHGHGDDNGHTCGEHGCH